MLSQMSRHRRQPGMQLGIAGPRKAIEPRGPLRGPGPLIQFSYPTCSLSSKNGDSGCKKYHHPTTSILETGLETGSEARRRVLPNLTAVW